MSLPEQFEVWAPFAHDVRLLVDDAEHPMSPDPTRSGWWVLAPEIAAPRDGQRYAYRLFDGTDWTKALPDPRTRRQPDGVHGASAIVDSDFPWTDDAWRGRHLRGQVIYELHVGTFTAEGTFEAAAGKLDYLLDLGINSIELMPVQPFGGERNWGYDGVDWFAVQESYGGPRGLKKLVDAAHNRGIAVILDVVYNHFGPDGNYNGMFGPYTTAGSTDWGDVVNLSGPASDEVRAYILDAVRQWLDEFHLDGLRLDAVHAYDDRRAYSIMEEIRRVSDSVAGQTGIPRTIIGRPIKTTPALSTTSPSAATVSPLSGLTTSTTASTPWSAASGTRTTSTSAPSTSSPIPCATPTGSATPSRSSGAAPTAAPSTCPRSARGG